MKPCRSKKNKYNFLTSSQKSIQITSDFDNGNISLIKQLTQLQYRLQSVPDVCNNNCYHNTVYNNLNNQCNNNSNNGNKKSWFYFKITANQNIKVKLYIEGVRMYDLMYQEYNWGKPVYKVGEQGKWRVLKDAFLIYREQVQLVIQYTFQSSESVYFALSIPFTYTQNEQYLKNLSHLIPQSLHFTDTILFQTSSLKKNFHMLTIQPRKPLNQSLLSQPARSIILITCRVHPGQVSSSFTLMGMLQFIIKPFCLQSEILRKMFTFVIFPMVNPEGVYEGNYRMDLYGENLNRVYIEPDQKKNQTICAIKSKIQQFINKGDKIMFHFDLHSHSTLRRSFLYGNAFDDIVVQTQTQLYSKLLQRNCLYFQQSLCQFGQKHMKFKDRGEQMTKQGCARVVISKLASVVYSYTIQSSIFPIQIKTQASPPVIINRQFQLISPSQPQYIFGFYDFSLKQHYCPEQPNIIDQNRILGTSILQSILDVFIKNPYSSIQLSTIYEYRKNIALKNLNTEQRFKMLDTKAYQKYKCINEYVQEDVYVKMLKVDELWGWLALDYGFGKVHWPQKYQWFKSNNFDKIKDNHKIKIKKLKSSYSHSQKSIDNFKKYTNLTSGQTNMKKTDLSKLRSKTEISEFQLPNIKKYSQQTKNQQTIIQKQQNPILIKIKSSTILRPINSTKIINPQPLQPSQALPHNFIHSNSNILLTFLQDSQSQKQQHSRSIQKRLLALKMGSMNKKQNRVSKQRSKSKINELNVNDEIFKNQVDQLPQIKLNNVIGKQRQKGLSSLRNIKGLAGTKAVERIKTEQVLSIQQQQRTQQFITNQRTYLNSLKKLSYSNSNSHSNSNNSLNPKTNKLLMLHKFNQSKKINHNHHHNQNNKSSLMKFPQIGKQFLITNMKNKCFNQFNVNDNENENDKIIDKIQDSLVQNKQSNIKHKQSRKNNKSQKKMLKIYTEGDVIGKNQ